MKRFLEQKNEKQFLKDFDFLFKRIQASNGEFDLRLRGHYFNIYYKGNSIAVISWKGNDYLAKLHQKFADNVFAYDSRFSIIKSGKSYDQYLIGRKHLKAFFQTKYLKKIASNIKKVNYGEEIVFEQTLITDNLSNHDLIIIDRQVTETSLKSKRLDLLGLKHQGENKYCFAVMEVKLGNNKELEHKVGNQLSFYQDHIKANHVDWKRNYEKVYEQLKATKIYLNFTHSTIQIVEPVEAWVVVGYYTGMANASISKLKTRFPSIVVKQFWNEFNATQSVTK